MTTQLQSLINKNDSFEIIRDQIAAILVNEIANQKALAVLATLDPAPWDLRIFLERSNPWNEFLIDSPDTREIVNIWYSMSEFDESASDLTQRQCAKMTFNIDVYGYAQSTETPSGHTPGDKLMSLDVQRAVRLVRNILMAGPNLLLQMKGLVWKRWISSVMMFQPTLENRTVENVQAARISFHVWANELSPQYEGQTLDYLAIDILRRETGEVLAEADYNYA